MATEEVPVTTAPVPLRREAIVPSSDRGRLAAIVATCSLAGLAGGMALSMLAETQRAARQDGQDGQVGSMRRGAHHAVPSGPRTWLGMKVKDVKQGACTGAEVTEISAEGPADRVGFRAGDVVLAFDGQLVCGHDHLIEEVRASDIGAAPEIAIRRGSARMVLRPTLAEMPPRVLGGLRPDER